MFDMTWKDPLQVKRRSVTRVVLVVSSLLLLFTTLGPTDPSTGEAPVPSLVPIPLFAPAPPPKPSAFAQAIMPRKPKGSWVRNQRSALMTPEAIRALAPSGNAQRTEMTVDLFSAGTQIADLRTRDEKAGRHRVRAWTGKLKQIADSDVTLVMKDGILAGTIRKGAMVYEIRAGADGQAEVIEIDTNALPSDHHPILVSPDELAATDAPTGTAAPTPSPATASDTGTMIDVMVVYTTVAKNANGGQNGIEALIALGISLANTALTNSQISTQFQLVHTAEVSYTESGNYLTDLVRLRTVGDGYMDDVHLWRDAHKADLVALIEDNLGGVCGVAYVMSPVSPQFAKFAFSVTEDSCITSYTLAHELGHNIGSLHDRIEDGESLGAYPYSFGHKETGKFRTIMAYPCTSGCTRINHYSNPNVKYQGTWPTGVDHNVDPVNSADNARAFTNVLSAVSNFRDSSDTTAPPAPAQFKIISP
jgi:peptidyl-Asp metalloendopeptidase